ncbi:5-dehydro-4-deoxyglucarate dehydratase [Pseudorhodoplanes sp.]|uniref:5-dehydro-4-deoxyglucarate dehydratase n=1 Tax=Pseudorhodoplanes sp. TaxID=1934341 RepID=UPI002C52E358|nr:5-dehydro-4-deoxyglucarate dehydratase [Pseudorhodoplanes sp.]HWV41309.1 5-dehydro-4-deoxyglucarate dehydratase [Pseudorhodoplanes sp.]
MTPGDLKRALPRGLLSFPLTDFDARGVFDARASAARIEWLLRYPAAAMFSAGGAGEFFSLTPEEYANVLRVAVQTAHGRIPVIGAAGYGTATAISYAQKTEKIGADGLLLLPPYLVEGPQEGLRAHIAAVCQSTRLPVIVYNRGTCRLQAETLARLAEDCPNLIAFKDGVGDVETIKAINALLGDRLLMLNGMPTAEAYAQDFRALGMATYSSAIFNFVPRTAIAFHRAVHDGDDATLQALTRDFLEPYVQIRKKQPGYAVSIIKAGAEIVGRPGGKVRPPLADLTAEERTELAALIERLGEQD